MDNKSATKAEAAPSVIEATMPLKKRKKDIKTEKKISDAMEIMEGFDVRLHQIEEKMDPLISLIRSNNEVKIGSVKAEAEFMPMDGSSLDEEPAQPLSDDSRFGRFVRGRGPFVGPYVRGSFVRGRSPVFRGRGLFVGGRYAGGRCGGLGHCGGC
ncbi:unnamed protein product [Thlaspi arvense]|uniref:Uncharacterized protein n=1 Tax=Thlaspi arvense TaxID=13288 RepID=A0AAU9RVL3_THLAR|nr:unnamed protein product [Thlaspi arvense]